MQANFAFLEGRDVRLATLGVQAERNLRHYLQTAIVKPRQYAELPSL
jgi:hypothetical protein